MEKICYGFYYMWARRPSWSRDLGHLYKRSFRLLMEALHEICPLVGQAVSEKIVKNAG